MWAQRRHYDDDEHHHQLHHDLDLKMVPTREELEAFDDNNITIGSDFGGGAGNTKSRRRSRGSPARLSPEKVQNIIMNFADFLKLLVRFNCRSVCVWLRWR